MSKALANLELCAASLDDAAMVADLETARNPGEPRDPAMFRFWWSASPPDEAWTALTATSKAVRGRGIARALKYETVAQAITLGATRIGTTNDGENAPILRLNAEMGYTPAIPWLELHRELA